MRNTAKGHHLAGRILSVACATAVAAVVATSAPQAAQIADLTPPPVPGNLEVQEGSKLFFAGHAIGTQNYICLPSGAGFAWTLFTPEATLFGRNGQQLTTHFFSPNPEEGGTVRPTWQHSRDTSTVWAQVAPDGSSTDSAFVAAGAIPWLLLDKSGTQSGPLGSGVLTATTQVQRLNTLGGSAPPTGCSSSTDVGRKAFVPYEADYFFYTLRRPGDSN